MGNIRNIVGETNQRTKDIEEELRRQSEQIRELLRATSLNGESSGPGTASRSAETPNASWLSNSWPAIAACPRNEGGRCLIC